MEKHAAATLLDKGIKVRVTAPLLFRVFGKKSISIVIIPPNQGTLFRISHLFLEAGITDEELEALDIANAHELFTRHGRMLCQVVAYAWLYGYWRGKLFAGLVSRWLYWHLNNVHLSAIVEVLIAMTSRESFTNTIRSVAAMKITAPNLSQTTKGS